MKLLQTLLTVWEVWMALPHWQGTWQPRRGHRLPAFAPGCTQGARALYVSPSQALHPSAKPSPGTAALTAE